MGKSTPSPPSPPPPPPTQDDAAVQKAAADERQRYRDRRGRASTVLTGNLPQSELRNPPTQTTTLLGGNR